MEYTFLLHLTINGHLCLAFLLFFSFSKLRLNLQLSCLSPQSIRSAQHECAFVCRAGSAGLVHGAESPLVKPADRNRLKCQGLAVSGVLKTVRGLSVRNVRTLNKQQRSSDLLCPSVQPDRSRTPNQITGRSAHKLLLTSSSAGVDLTLLVLLCDLPAPALSVSLP